MNAEVNTATIKDHRKLRFQSIADVRGEVERLVGAERAGRLRRSGNWTLGQNLNHLAAWINYAFDGFPIRRPPFPIRWLLKGKRKEFTEGAMPRGIRILGVKGGTTATEDVPLDAALPRYLAALERLERNAPTRESPIFGPMTHAEWIGLNLRHAELHLGYLHP